MFPGGRSANATYVCRSKGTYVCESNTEIVASMTVRLQLTYFLFPPWESHWVRGSYIDALRDGRIVRPRKYRRKRILMQQIIRIFSQKGNVTKLSFTIYSTSFEVVLCVMILIAYQVQFFVLICVCVCVCYDNIDFHQRSKKFVLAPVGIIVTIISHFINGSVVFTSGVSRYFRSLSSCWKQ